MKGFKKAIIFGLLSGALGVSAPASAAERLKLAPPKIKPISKQEFAEARAKLGACMVKTDRAKVAKYLVYSDSVTIDYEAMGTDLQKFFFYFPSLMTGCSKYNLPHLRDSVFMAPGGLRNLLLEASYLDAAKATPAPLLDAKGEPAAAPDRVFMTKDDKLPAVQAFAALADCVAAKGSAEADAVLRSATGLPDERTTAVSLAPVIGTCVQEGANITLTTASIRIIAAEGMWQRYARNANVTLASK